MGVKNIDAVPETATASNKVAFPQSVNTAPAPKNITIAQRPPIKLRGKSFNSSTIRRAADDSAESNVDTPEINSDTISAAVIGAGNNVDHVPNRSLSIFDPISAA